MCIVAVEIPPEKLKKKSLSFLLFDIWEKKSLLGKTEEWKRKVRVSFLSCRKNRLFFNLIKELILFFSWVFFTEKLIYLIDFLFIYWWSENRLLERCGKFKKSYLKLIWRIFRFPSFFRNFQISLKFFSNIFLKFFN